MNLPAASTLRLAKELNDIQKGTDLSLHVAFRDDDVSHVRALLIGPPGTPYEYGMFELNLTFPPEYPRRPPKVRAITTNSGRTRFNPNIYANGLVCVSILGTWRGHATEKWTTNHGVESLLISIQSLLSANPYQNEPGFEHLPPEGVDSKRYSRKVRHETLRISVVQRLESILGLQKRTKAQRYTDNALRNPEHISTPKLELGFEHEEEALYEMKHAKAIFDDWTGSSELPSNSPFAAFMQGPGINSDSKTAWAMKLFWFKKYVPGFKEHAKAYKAQNPTPVLGSDESDSEDGMDSFLEDDLISPFVSTYQQLGSVTSPPGPTHSANVHQASHALPGLLPTTSVAKDTQTPMTNGSQKYSKPMTQPDPASPHNNSTKTPLHHTQTSLENLSNAPGHQQSNLVPSWQNYTSGMPSYPAFSSFPPHNFMPYLHQSGPNMSSTVCCLCDQEAHTHVANQPPGGASSNFVSSLSAHQPAAENNPLAYSEVMDKVFAPLPDQSVVQSGKHKLESSIDHTSGELYKDYQSMADPSKDPKMPPKKKFSSWFDDPMSGDNDETHSTVTSLKYYKDEKAKSVMLDGKGKGVATDVDMLNSPVLTEAPEQGMAVDTIEDAGPTPPLQKAIEKPNTASETPTTTEKDAYATDVDFDPFVDLMKRHFLWYYDIYVAITADEVSEVGIRQPFFRTPFESPDNGMAGHFDYQDLVQRLRNIRIAIEDETVSWAVEGATVKRESMPVVNVLEKAFENVSSHYSHAEDPQLCSFLPLVVHPFVWNMTYNGRRGTLFDGAVIRILIRFSPRFPAEQPRVNLITPLYHVRVSITNNVLCYVPEDPADPVSHVKAIIHAIEEEDPVHDPRATVNPLASQLCWGDEKQKEVYKRKLRESVLESPQSTITGLHIRGTQG